MNFHKKPRKRGTIWFYCIFIKKFPPIFLQKVDIFPKMIVIFPKIQFVWPLKVKNPTFSVRFRPLRRHKSGFLGYFFTQKEKFELPPRVGCNIKNESFFFVKNMAPNAHISDQKNFNPKKTLSQPSWKLIIYHFDAL